MPSSSVHTIAVCLMMNKFFNRILKDSTCKWKYTNCLYICYIENSDYGTIFVKQKNTTVICNLIPSQCYRGSWQQPVSWLSSVMPNNLHLNANTILFEQPTAIAQHLQGCVAKELDQSKSQECNRKCWRMPESVVPVSRFVPQP